MRWQVFNSYSEILSLDHSLSNFLICLQLHCSQVLKEEKHQESSCNISYNYDKRHNFLLKVDFVHEKKVYIAWFASGLHKVDVLTLIFIGVDCTVGRREILFIYYQVARGFSATLRLKSIIYFGLVGLVELGICTFFRRKFYTLTVWSTCGFLLEGALPETIYEIHLTVGTEKREVQIIFWIHLCWIASQGSYLFLVNFSISYKLRCYPMRMPLEHF